jgi:superfamily II DNA helicase RecQ
LLSATVPQVLEQSIFQSLGIRNVKVFREPVVVRKELSIGVHKCNSEFDAKDKLLTSIAYFINFNCNCQILIYVPMRNDTEMLEKYYIEAMQRDQVPKAQVKYFQC